MSSIRRFAVLLSLLLCLGSCRKDEPVLPSTNTNTGGGSTGTGGTGQEGPIKGFFLLNEGNMGSNKASLDYYDAETGVYSKNIYPERNPGVVKELGDVGNDIQIYGDKLYAVINCSHFVEVMDVRTARHIGVVSIPNCRYLAFKGPYAYVSSYAGPVQIDPNARLGYVAKVDTASLTVLETCVVGYQPEEMVIVGDKLYVANSGGYRVPNYDNTVSVIDLNTFQEVKKIEVAINLHRMELDHYGNIWVSSRGDYYGTRSMTFVIDSKTDKVTDKLELLPNSNMTLCGDSLYVYSTEWSYIKKYDLVRYRRYQNEKGGYPQFHYGRDGQTDQDPLRHRRQSRYAGDLRDRCQGLYHPGDTVLFHPGRKKEMVGDYRRHSGPHRIYGQTTATPAIIFKLTLYYDETFN